MLRRDEIDRKKKMLEDLKAEKKKDKKESNKLMPEDVNHDGKVDEKDIEAVKKKIKRIVD